MRILRGFLKNKSTTPMFYYVRVSGADLQLDSFEELAMPLFDHLCNFAHWLTQNREEAEDLVQETYAKALKGLSSFQLGANFRALVESKHSGRWGTSCERGRHPTRDIGMTGVFA